MPKVPDYSSMKRPVKVIYNPKNKTEPASIKQKDYLLTIYQRRKLPAPDVSKLTKGEAAVMISNLINGYTEDN